MAPLFGMNRTRAATTVVSKAKSTTTISLTTATTTITPTTATSVTTPTTATSVAATPQEACFPTIEP